MTLVLILKRRWWYPIQDVDNPHRLASGKPWRGQIDYDRVRIRKKPIEIEARKVSPPPTTRRDDRVIQVRAPRPIRPMPKREIKPIRVLEQRKIERQQPMEAVIPAVIGIIETTTIIEDTLTDDIIMILGGLL